MNTIQMAFENTKNEKIQNIVRNIQTNKRERLYKIALIRRKINNQIERYKMCEPLLARMLITLKNDENEYKRVIPYLKAFCYSDEDNHFFELYWDLQEVPTNWKRYTQEKIYRQIGVPI